MTFKTSISSICLVMKQSIYLLILQGQVILKLTVSCDQYAFPFGVVLGSTGTSQHLEDIKGAELYPSSLLGAVDLDGQKKNITVGSPDSCVLSSSTSTETSIVLENNQVKRNIVCFTEKKTT